MKTIGNGATFNRWVIGKKTSCSSCGQGVEFDATDCKNVKESSGYDSDGDMYLPWVCPTCNRSNSLSGPNRYRLVRETALRNLNECDDDGRQSSRPPWDIP